MKNINYQTRLLSIMAFITLFKDSSIAERQFYTSIKNEFKNIPARHFIDHGTVSVEEDSAWVYTSNSLARFYNCENTTGKTNFPLFVFEN